YIMRLKIISFSVLLISNIILVKAQTQIIQYTYDNCGNRINRTIVIPPSNPPNQTTGLDQIYGEEIGESVISIFPNPNQGILNINIENLPSGSENEMLLFDLSGKKVFHLQNLEESNQINITDLKQGTYIMKILLNSNMSKWKIIRQ
ncbi:T9SS type A sorting domain-containing protein, partial [candidate division KSB1 bacterium]